MRPEREQISNEAEIAVEPLLKAPGALLTALPEFDVSSIEAVRKTLHTFDAWRAHNNFDMPATVAAQAVVTRTAIDNMRFPSAQECKVMRDAAHARIEKLKVLVVPVESLPA